MIKRLPDAVLVGAAIFFVVAAVRQRVSPRPEVSRVEDWEQLAKDGQVLGPDTAKVVIIEFSDFQCPACARTADVLRQIRAAHPRDVRVVYRHFPLESIHAHAFTSAVAAECAGRAGRFEALHDLLFARQSQIGVVPWTELAAAAGVMDVPAFEQCLGSADAAARVRADQQAGRVLGLTGTPTLIINGEMIVGGLTFPDMERMVVRAAQ